MRRTKRRALLFLGMTTLAVVAVGASAITAQELEGLKKPEPTVPEIFTLTGEFVRMAYNNEGWVTLGYRTANESQGDEWMLLEMGVTLREKVKNQLLKRDHIRLKLPDETTVMLASQQDFAKAELRALNRRADNVRDNIGYFPVSSNMPCALRFFVEPGKRGVSYDQVELDWRRACVGRVYFRVPGGIQTGQYWLIVHFNESEVQVPFRILTKEEEKEFRKKWQTIKKEHDAGYEQD